MENKSLKEKTVHGLVFRFSERILAQLTSLVVSIILARILSPEDYGIISLIAILITICDVLVTYGFGNALIQKKDADQIDFSSCFYASLSISVFIYIILFITSPYLAKYFDYAVLSPVIRVMGLRIIIGAYNSIQHAYVSRHMLFKKFFFSTLFGTIFSGICAILLAYRGFGVWALVSNYLVNVIIDTIILSITISWRPTLEFSFRRLKTLFSFGWKILASGLLGTISTEIRSVVIAKKYTSSDLAFYDKGESFPKLISTQINTTISSVLFPVVASVQDDQDALKGIVRRGLKSITFLMVPLLLGLAAIGDTFITTLLTEKWLPSVTYLRIFCVVFLMMPYFRVGEAFLNGIGKSEKILIIQIVTRILSISLLLLSMRFGPIAIALSVLLVQAVNVVFMVYYFWKYCNYTFFEQMKDIVPIILIGLLMYAIVYLLSYIHLSQVYIMLTQILVGGLVYLGSSYVFKIDSLNYFSALVRNFLHKHRKTISKEK